MANQRRNAPSGLLSDDIAGWLAGEALGNSEPAALFESLCRRLRAAGVPIMRGNVSFNVLHPLYSAGALTWTADGVDVQLFDWNAGVSAQYLRSPMHHAIRHGLPILRRRLTGRTALLDFPVLPDLRDRGGHDYLLFLIPFAEHPRDDGPLNDPQGRRGIICSWVGDRPGGFNDGEIRLLQRITSRLVVALKGRLDRAIAHNVASAYLGRHAGQAVLRGAIHRGDGEKLQAALWYSDLRHSTTLADHDTAEGFLRVLNRYFEMTAGAIHDHGGEVVSFIGDAVLGFFRTDGDPGAACARALAAAREAQFRLATHEPDDDAARIEFGIGLHLGEVIHGNVGVPERLQFTLVGSPVNEVARIEDLTKTLGEPLVASEAFANAVPGPWRTLGEHALRGIMRPIGILAPVDHTLA